MSLLCLRSSVAGALAAALLLLSGPTSSADWVELVDETATRLVAPPGLGADDVAEKDFAWGDVDNDGDIDLIVMRKEPFTTAGKRTNLLLLNENGILTDRTLEFASNSDVADDHGFSTPTNDRDAVLVDVNNDGWLDIVTAVTVSDGDPKHLGHPRVYINLGEDPSMLQWLGFRHENARIPTMFSFSGQAGFNPRFCSVAAGDLTGDGLPDLWFGDYDSSGVGGGVPQPPGADFNDRLLINLGGGFFADRTRTRLTGVVPGNGQEFDVSAFGAAVAIADMNGDGVKDIIKQTSLNAPRYVGIAYNTPDNEGFFDTYDVVNTNQPYYVVVGELNNDGQLDIIVQDDGDDLYLLNQGNNAGGAAQFVALPFSFDASQDQGFGSNTLIVDLNNDGWNDVLIADVDVDDPGCDRRMSIYRNLAGQPGDAVVLEEQTSGTACNIGIPPASCLVASIPADRLTGVHDVAAFDIDGDGWKDLVIGRCTGTQVYMNQPPAMLSFSYPEGLPTLVSPGASFEFKMQVNEIGVVHDPGTGRMFASVAGAPFSEVPLVDLGGRLYQASLPPAAGCADRVEFYFTADANGGGQTFNDPPLAPAETYRAVTAFGVGLKFEDDIEGDVSGWLTLGDASLVSGAWEQAEPVGTSAAPDADAEPSPLKVMAFVTENGQIGGADGAADVDGGPAELISPAIDLAGSDAIISYSRWFVSSGGTPDVLEVSVSADGSTWHPAETVTQSQAAWQRSSFLVGDIVTPSATVQVRFRVADNPNDSLTESGVDLFRVEEFLCNAPSPAGRVPDGSTLPGTALRIDSGAGDQISLSWGESCELGDSDYAVYEGMLGDFASHTVAMCSTGGATSTGLSPAPGNTYYLVVPSNGTVEGSYGTASDGAPRTAAFSACFPQSVAACP